MIRPVNEEELRRIGLMLWAIKNSCSWKVSDKADVVPRALCAAIVSQIAYCFILDEERERHIRAKVVPSDWHNQLINQAKIDIVEVLRRSDIPNIEIFENQYFVVIRFQLGDIVFIGIRGTQFSYDWLKNVNFLKTADSRFGTGVQFHGGFYKEAAELDEKIVEYFKDTAENGKLNSNLKLCICGHSLGGAIAALVLQSSELRSSHDEALAHMARNTFCYTFGAPRITSKTGQLRIAQPVAFRTVLDIVPHCPPKLAGYYANFLDQRSTTGLKFTGRHGREFVAFPTWLRKLVVYEGVKNHNIEIYRSEIRESIKQSHKNIDQYITRMEA